jgi:DNA-directed RNA polymerase subunit RPC12/RpoP
MSAAQRVRAINFIKCHKCSHFVELATTDRLPEEFSIRCPRCSHRSFYRFAEIRSGDIDQAQAAARAPASAHARAALRKADKRG